MRIFVLALTLLVTAGASAPAPIDSQIALERYELELSSLKAPKAMIFSYTISQAGAFSIEQRHRIYRSGQRVRDETLAVDGSSLAQKVVTISSRPDRYEVGRLAPRTSGYTMLFLRSVPEGAHMNYVFEVRPIIATSTGFSATRLTIDGETFLPRSIAFRTSDGTTTGTGELQYGKSGSFWVPLTANIEAKIKGKPTRERITWSDYRFPSSLPDSTFRAPKPLPTVTP